jgi:Methyltransferase FkbM domain
MTRRRRLWLLATAATLFVAILGAVIRNQVKVYRGRQARAALAGLELEKRRQLAAEHQQRQALFDLLQPVALANCRLERFGEAHDGGYLMCGNLLGNIRSGYSYGIAGYDKWGCDISTKFKLTVHQYDCFNLARPSCPLGRTSFHEECVGDASEMVQGRRFDTITNQLARNGDGADRIVLKIDVEGAEWDSFLSISDQTLERIDQMAVEFHWLQDKDANWVHDDKYVRVVRRLKQHFEIAHLHFNNASCAVGLDPFPTWAYEVSFVNKQLAVVDSSREVVGLHRLDAPNNPALADCQPKHR